MPETKEITIRLAGYNDLDALVTLLQTLFALEEDFSFNEKNQRHGLTLMLDNARGIVLVADQGGKIIGMCSGQLVISTAEGGPAALVEDVVVLPGHRGKGVGRLLMESIGDWARKNHALRLQLLADQTNSSALDFYRKLAWQTTQLICLRKMYRGES